MPWTYIFQLLFKIIDFIGGRMELNQEQWAAFYSFAQAIIPTYSSNSSAFQHYKGMQADLDAQKAALAAGPKATS